jgi:hypothetical protein
VSCGGKIFEVWSAMRQPSRNDVRDTYGPMALVVASDAMKFVVSL